MRLEAIAMGSLFALAGQPTLQLVVVIALVSCLLLTAITVLGLIIFFAHSNPSLLFSPKDIAPEIHSDT